MNKSKLIEVIKTLSSKEFKEFGIFLNGTPYRKTAGLYKLYNYLKKYHPEYPPDKIKKEVVYKKLFKDNGNVNKRIFDLMYNLYHVLENFLLQKELEENSVDRNFLMLEILKKRKLDKLFFKKIDQVQRDWKKETPPGIDQLHNDYKLARTCYFHPNYSIFPGQEINLKTLISKIDKYYILVKLFLILLVTHNKLYLENSFINVNNLIDTLFRSIEYANFSSVPQITMLTELLKAYKTKNYLNAPKFKRYFFNYYKLYNNEEISTLLVCYQQSLYENHKRGIPNSLMEMFDLYKFGFSHNLFIEDGYIDENTFKDVVYVACSIGELDWGLNFVEEYAKYLDEKNRVNIVQLCKSIIAFNSNNFGESLELLVYVKFANPIYACQVKGLQMQCYFELEKFDDLFYNLTRSFSIFLKRNNKLSVTHKDSWFNFIKHANKLYNLKSEPNIYSDHIKKEIEQTKDIPFKMWLLNKAVELIKNK